MTDYTLGIDVNRYRKDVPLRQVKKQGGRFVIGKCSEGLTWVDPTYQDYKLDSASRYLPFGGYMYWLAKVDAVKQAKHYVDSLGETEFPPIVDVERYGNCVHGTSTPLYPIGTNINHLRIVLNEVERLTERKPMIYTNYNSWKILTGSHSMITEYEAWVANYGRTTPLLPIPLKKWMLWQFTSIYKVEGYSRGIDANWFNGNEADFDAWLKSTQKPEPPPPPEERGFYFKFKGERWYGRVRKLNIG